MRRSFKSPIAALTLFAFLFQQVHALSAYAAEPPVSRVVTAFQIDIPAELGKVDHLSSGDGPAVIHIQTAHGNYEAQKQIQKLLKYLQDEYGIHQIFLEGSAYPLVPEKLRLFPDDMPLTMQVADALTKKALVKGPELFLLENPGVSADGIENPATYRENVSAFKKVLIQKEMTAGFTAAMREQIARLSAPYLNKPLREFLKKRDAYESGAFELSGWLSYIKEEARETLDIRVDDAAYQIDWPMLVRIFTLQKIESRLDQAAYVQERAAFLSVTKHYLDSGLYAQVEKQLESKLSEGNSSTASGAIFEAMVQALPRNFDYSPYPNLKLFAGHLILQSETDPELLIKETQTLAEKITARLAKSAKEKEVVALLASARLAEKIFELQLSPEEHKKILAAPDSVRPSLLTPRFDALNKDKRVRDSSFSHVKEIDELFDAALEFYRLARQRDEEMSANLLEKMKSRGIQKAVVVTGGFHAQPFGDYFAAKGFNYALISPRFSDTGGREAYLKSFLQAESVTEKKSTLETVPFFMLTPEQLASLGFDSPEMRYPLENLVHETLKAAGKKNIRARAALESQLKLYGGRLNGLGNPVFVTNDSASSFDERTAPPSWEKTIHQAARSELRSSDSLRKFISDTAAMLKRKGINLLYLSTDEIVVESRWKEGMAKLRDLADGYVIRIDGPNSLAIESDIHINGTKKPLWRILFSPDKSVVTANWGVTKTLEYSGNPLRGVALDEHRNFSLIVEPPFVTAFWMKNGASSKPMLSDIGTKLIPERLKASGLMDSVSFPGFESRESAESETRSELRGYGPPAVLTGVSRETYLGFPIHIYFAGEFGQSMRFTIDRANSRNEAIQYHLFYGSANQGDITFHLSGGVVTGVLSDITYPGDAVYIVERLKVLSGHIFTAESIASLFPQANGRIPQADDSVDRRSELRQNDSPFSRINPDHAVNFARSLAGIEDEGLIQTLSALILGSPSHALKILDVRRILSKPKIESKKNALQHIGNKYKGAVIGKIPTELREVYLLAQEAGLLNEEGVLTARSELRENEPVNVRNSFGYPFRMSAEEGYKALLNEAPEKAVSFLLVLPSLDWTKLPVLPLYKKGPQLLLDAHPVPTPRSSVFNLNENDFFLVSEEGYLIYVPASLAAQNLDHFNEYPLVTHAELEAGALSVTWEKLNEAFQKGNDPKKGHQVILVDNSVSQVTFFPPQNSKGGTVKVWTVWVDEKTIEPQDALKQILESKIFPEELKAPFHELMRGSRSELRAKIKIKDALRDIHSAQDVLSELVEGRKILTFKPLINAIGQIRVAMLRGELISEDRQRGLGALFSAIGGSVADHNHRDLIIRGLNAAAELSRTNLEEAAKAAEEFFWIVNLRVQMIPAGTIPQLSVDIGDGFAGDQEWPVWAQKPEDLLSGLLAPQPSSEVSAAYEAPLNDLRFWRWYKKPELDGGKISIITKSGDKVSFPFDKLLTDERVRRNFKFVLRNALISRDPNLQTAEDKKILSTRSELRAEEEDEEVFTFKIQPDEAGELARPTVAHNGTSQWQEIPLSLDAYGEVERFLSELGMRGKLGEIKVSKLIRELNSGDESAEALYALLLQGTKSSFIFNLSGGEINAIGYALATIVNSNLGFSMQLGPILDAQVSFEPNKGGVRIILPRSELRLPDGQASTTAWPPAIPERARFYSELDLNGMLEDPDAIATEITRLFKEFGIGFLAGKGYELQVLSGFPDSLYLNIYPSDPYLHERLKQIDDRANLRKIEVPNGAIGQARISLIQVEGKPALYLEELHPSFSLRKLQNEDPESVKPVRLWIHDVLETIIEVSKRARFEHVYGKTVKVAKIHNHEMLNSQAVEYYEKPFRQMFKKKTVTFRNIFNTDSSIREQDRQDIELYGNPSLRKGGTIEIWQHDVNVWINPKMNPSTGLLPKSKFNYARPIVEKNVVRVPMVEMKRLSQMTGKVVLAQDQSRQTAGSFKAYGVYYEVYEEIMAIISDKEHGRQILNAGLNIVTQSTGNHGIAMIDAVGKVIRELLEKYKDDAELAAGIKKIQPIVYTLSDLNKVKKRGMEEALARYRAIVGDETQGAIKDSYPNYEAALDARTIFIGENRLTNRYMEHGGEKIMLGHGVAAMQAIEDLERMGIGPDEKVVFITNIGAGGPAGYLAAAKRFRPKNTSAVFVQSDRWDAGLKEMQYGRPMKNPQDVPLTDVVNVDGEEIPLIYADGHAVNAFEPGVSDVVKAFVDAGVAVDESDAYNYYGPLMLSDLDEHYGENNGAVVGGTFALTGAALIKYYKTIPAIRDARVVVLLATEGNVPKEVMDHTRAGLPFVEQILDQYTDTNGASANGEPVLQVKSELGAAARLKRLEIDRPQDRGPAVDRGPWTADSSSRSELRTNRSGMLVSFLLGKFNVERYSADGHFSGQPKVKLFMEARSGGRATLLLYNQDERALFGTGRLPYLQITLDVENNPADLTLSFGSDIPADHLLRQSLPALREYIAAVIAEAGASQLFSSHPIHFDDETLADHSGERAEPERSELRAATRLKRLEIDRPQDRGPAVDRGPWTADSSSRSELRAGTLDTGERYKIGGVVKTVAADRGPDTFPEFTFEPDAEYSNPFFLSAKSFPGRPGKNSSLNENEGWVIQARREAGVLKAMIFYPAKKTGDTLEITGDLPPIPADQKIYYFTSLSHVRLPLAAEDEKYEPMPVSWLAAVTGRDGKFEIGKNWQALTFYSLAQTAPLRNLFEEKGVHNIVLLGAPNSGKGTVTEALLADLNAGRPEAEQYVKLPVGDFLRAILGIVKNFAENDGADPLGAMRLITDLEATHFNQKLSNGESLDSPVINAIIKATSKQPEFAKKPGIFVKILNRTNLTAEEIAGIREKVAAGKMIDNPIIVRMINAILSQPEFADAPGILFDGFPRTAGQLDVLNSREILLNGKPLTMDLYLNLAVPDEVLFARAAARGRADDEKIRERVAVFNQETAPMISAILAARPEDFISIEGHIPSAPPGQEINLVYNSIVAALHQHLQSGKTESTRSELRAAKEEFTIRRNGKAETLYIQPTGRLNSLSPFQIIVLPETGASAGYVAQLSQDNQNIGFTVRTSPDSNNLVAYILGSAHGKDKKKYFYIQANATQKDYQKLGIFSKILRLTLNEALSRGLTRAVLNVEASGRAAGTDLFWINRGARVSYINIAPDIPEINPAVYQKNIPLNLTLSEINEMQDPSQRREKLLELMQQHPKGVLRVDFDIPEMLARLDRESVNRSELRANDQAKTVSKNGEIETLQVVNPFGKTVRLNVREGMKLLRMLLANKKDGEINFFDLRPAGKTGRMKVKLDLGKLVFQTGWEKQKDKEPKWFSPVYDRPNNFFIVDDQGSVAFISPVLDAAPKEWDQINEWERRLTRVTAQDFQKVISSRIENGRRKDSFYKPRSAKRRWEGRYDRSELRAKKAEEFATAEVLKATKNTNVIPTVTPLQAGRRAIDVKSTRNYFQYLKDQGVTAIFVVGATGEFYTMTPEFRARAIQTLTQIGKELGFTVLTNISGDSEAEVIKNATIADQAGADGVVIAPRYYLNTDNEILDHVRRIKNEFKASGIDKPLFIYNNPALHKGEKKDIDPQVIRTLAEEKLLTGIKSTSAPEKTAEYLKVSRDLAEKGMTLAVYPGNDPYLAPAIQDGAWGIVSATGNVLPQSRKIANTSEPEEIEAFQRDIAEAAKVLIQPSFASASKEALYQMGIIASPRVMNPEVTPYPDAEQKQTVGKMLEANKLLPGSRTELRATSGLADKRAALVDALQRYVDLLSEGDDFSVRKPDVILLLGNPDLKTFVEFARRYKAEFQGIPIVLAGGFGRGTIPLIQKTLKRYSKVLSQEDRDLLRKGIKEPGSVNEKQVIRIILKLEGIDFSKTKILDEIGHSRNTAENFDNTYPRIAPLIEGIDHPVLALGTAPWLEKRGQAAAEARLAEYTPLAGKNLSIKKLQIYPPRVKSFTNQGLVDFAGYAARYPEKYSSDVLPSWKSQNELKGFYDVRGVAESERDYSLLIPVQSAYEAFLHASGATFDAAKNKLVIPSRSELRTLVLQRYPGEQIVINGQIVLTVEKVNRNEASLTFDAPPGLTIHFRSEFLTEGFSAGSLTDRLTRSPQGITLSAVLDEPIWIGVQGQSETQIRIIVTDIRDGGIRLGIDAPKSVGIQRRELIDGNKGYRSELRASAQKVLRPQPDQAGRVKNIDVYTYSSAKNVALEVAGRLIEAIKREPQQVLGLATGGTMEEVYANIVSLFAKDKSIDFSRAVTFNLDEYLGLEGSHPQSYHSFMDEHLFSKLREIDESRAFKRGNTHLFNASGGKEAINKEIKQYIEAIQKAGGIDFQLLGIGSDGHIAFLEPAPEINPEFLSELGDGQEAAVAAVRDFNEFVFTSGASSSELTHSMKLVLNKQRDARSKLGTFEHLRNRLFDVRKSAVGLRNDRSSLTNDLNELGASLNKENVITFYIPELSFVSKFILYAKLWFAGFTPWRVHLKDKAAYFSDPAKHVYLAVPTIIDNSRYFKSLLDVPRQALSLTGMIQNAKEIVLAANNGKEKAVKGTLDGPVTSLVPASILQQRRTDQKTAFILQEGAASLLKKGILNTPKRSELRLIEERTSGIESRLPLPPSAAGVSDSSGRNSEKTRSEMREKDWASDFIAREITQGVVSLFIQNRILVNEGPVNLASYIKNILGRPAYAEEIGGDEAVSFIEAEFGADAVLGLSPNILQPEITSSVSPASNPGGMVLIDEAVFQKLLDNPRAVFSLLHSARNAKSAEPVLGTVADESGIKNLKVRLRQTVSSKGAALETELKDLPGLLSDLEGGRLIKFFQPRPGETKAAAQKRIVEKDLRGGAALWHLLPADVSSSSSGFPTNFALGENIHKADLLAFAAAILTTTHLARELSHLAQDGKPLLAAELIRQQVDRFVQREMPGFSPDSRGVITPSSLAEYIAHAHQVAGYIQTMA